jgi:hypothetical protein
MLIRRTLHPGPPLDLISRDDAYRPGVLDGESVEGPGPSLPASCSARFLDLC